MVRTFQNMGRVGGAMRVPAMQALHSIVFSVLKRYWLLFLRSINSVSRRQEFRADELAAIIAGPQSLITGLQLVHVASMAWPPYCGEELGPMLRAGLLPPIAAGFSRFLATPLISRQVKSGIEAEINEGKVEAYDSHPPLRERIAAAKTLVSQNNQEDTRPALSLLENTGATERVFLQACFPGLQKDLKSAIWEEQAQAVELCK
jgi:heat shock protein HtpX